MEIDASYHRKIVLVMDINFLIIYAIWILVLIIQMMVIMIKFALVYISIIKIMKLVYIIVLPIMNYVNQKDITIKLIIKSNALILWKIVEEKDLKHLIINVI